MNPLWLLLIGIATIVIAIVVLRLHAFLALTLAALVVGGLTPLSSIERYAEGRKMSEPEKKRLVNQRLGERVASQFGNTCANIGILIALASIIGKFLLDSGAADRIVRSTMRVLGEPRAPLAFLGSGFLLGIPVFFDTVFYLLMPLGKALRLRTGRNYVLYVLTIIAGATMTHSLVPPTPGPLFVATELKINMGYMMIGGILVGLVTCSSGYAYAVWLNRRFDVPLRDTPDITVAELAATGRRDERELPPFWLALLPIMLPVVLIGGYALLDLVPAEKRSESLVGILKVMRFLGDTNVALGLATAAAFWLVLKYRPKTGKPVSTLMEEALMGGGVIILITAAGGAFGGMLQQTGVGYQIQSLASAYQVGILPLAWLVTILIRTAQGSATVAMFTAVGIVAPMVTPETLSFHPVYVALAIGCGSKPFPWMNDSGFWLISKMSGMTIGETLKSFSVMQGIMAATGLITVVILSKVFPMV